MSVERNIVNAGRTLRALMWFVLTVALWFFVETVTGFDGVDSEFGRQWRKFAGIAFLGALIVLPPANILIVRISRHIRPWVAGNGFAWALAAVVLYAIAPVAWLRARAAALWAGAGRTRAGRFLGRRRQNAGRPVPGPAPAERGPAGSWTATAGSSPFSWSRPSACGRLH